MWGVIVDGAWRAGRFTAVTLLAPLFVVLIAAAVVFAARTLGSRLVPALIGSIAVVVVIQPWITERPQLASFALLPLTIGLAARATRDERLQWGWLALLLAEREIELVEVPHEEFDSMGPNVLALGPRRALALEGNPVTRERMERAGVDVTLYRGEELSVKGDGGPTCLTRPLLRAT